MRILLVDDHTLFREALLHVLKQFESTAVVIEASTAREAVRLAGHYHDLDLILLDLALPGSDGLSILPELRELRPTVPLVILSASEDPSAVRQALTTGAMGYIPKSCSSHEMLSGAAATKCFQPCVWSWRARFTFRRPCWRLWKRCRSRQTRMAAKTLALTERSKRRRHHNPRRPRQRLDPSTSTD